MIGRKRIAFASAALALGVLPVVVTTPPASAAVPAASRIGTARFNEVVSIDASGRHVAFGRSDNDFGAGPDTQVRVFDTMTRRNTIVSVTSNGDPAPGFSGAPSISADGRYVAFQSTAELVGVPGGTGVARVWRRDLQTGTTVLVSIGRAGGAIPGRSAAISGDGRYVVFARRTGSIENAVLLRDVVAGTTRALGTQGDDFWLTTAISDSGRYVAWTRHDLVVLDRHSGTTTTVEPPSGEEMNGHVHFLDGDRLVAFRTSTPTRDHNHVFVHDLATGVTTMTPATDLDGVDRAAPVIASGGTLYDLADGARIFGSQTCARGDDTVVGAGGGYYTTVRPPAEGEFDPHLWLAREPSRAYRLVAADGGVFTYGGAKFYGSAANLPLRAPIVTMASTRDDRGYWLIAADGGVFTYGNARFLGSLGALHLTSPIVGMAPTPDGKGYWLVASDGGVFAFGTARFHGSLGAVHLTSPITGIAAAPDGNGYWLAARDGGVFAFGSAKYHGSAAGAAQAAVVGIGAAPDGKGYWLATDVGGLFAYGSAKHLGSLKSLGVTPSHPIVAFRSASDTCGYRFAASDGGVFPFGGSGFEGSAGNLPLVSPIVAIG